MFGGLAFLLDGKLLCGAATTVCWCASVRATMAGRWHLRASLMVMGDRRMNGWVRAGAAAFGDDTLRKRLLDAALAYVLSLPPK
jgi:hypothetical protein